MTFVLDNKNTGVLTGDSRNNPATFTQDSHSAGEIIWVRDLNTWAQEIRTWGQLASALTLDTRN